MTQLKLQKKLRKPEASTRVSSFLSKHRTGVVATVGPNGDPHATVVYFEPHKDLSVLFLTKQDTKKFDNLLRTPRAELVVFDEATQTTVQLKGHVKLVTDEAKVHEAFMNAMRQSVGKSNNVVPPISQLSAGAYVAFELQPQNVRMSVYTKNGHFNHEIEEIVR